MKKRLIYFLLIIFTGSLFLGCELKHKFSTVGKEYDLLLFADKEFHDENEELIYSSLSDDIFFTHKESKFNILKKNIKDIDKLKKYKNIIIIDNVLTTDDVTTFLSDALGSDTVFDVEEMTIAHKEDVWGEGQSVVFILFNGKYFTKSKLSKALDKGTDILNNYVQKRIEKQVFQEDKNNKLVKKVNEKLNLDLFIPKRYFLFKEEENFVSTVTRAPDRLYFFHVTENIPEVFDQNTLYGIRDRLTDKYYNGDRVFRKLNEWKKEDKDINYFVGYKELKIKNNIVYKIHGLWENVEDTNGGPFITYFFVKDKKLYVFDAMLFHPGGNKWPYINKMDIIQKKNVENNLLE